LSRAAEQRVKPASLQAIEQAARVAWLPVELDIEVTEAVAAEAGEEGLRAWARQAMIENLGGPLLGSFLQAALRLFGRNPHRIIKKGSSAFESVMRGCGQIHVEDPHDHSFRVVLGRVPGVLLRSPVYLRGIAGSLEAVLSVANIAGEVVTESIVAAERRAVYRVRWH
jgi:hypothetical protein